MPEESARDPQPLPEEPPRIRRGWRALLLLSVCVALFGGTEYAVAALLRRNPYVVPVTASVLAMVGVALALMVFGAIVRIRQTWVVPSQRLRRALEEIHAGALAIDQLPADLSGLESLRPAVMDLLKDLRQKRADLAQLEHEMRQRLAQRTDALERTVGSLRAQATRDALTGLFNRRMLDQTLETLVDKCNAQEQPLCLLMIDVDDFKMLNDTLGHAAGDDLLRSIGQLIRSTIRQGDLGFRCGGDEFVVVMPASGKAEGIALARRLVELVDGLTRTLAVRRKPRLSIGLSNTEDLPTPVTVAALTQEADKVLYAVKAKRKGKAA